MHKDIFIRAQETNWRITILSYSTKMRKDTLKRKNSFTWLMSPSFNPRQHRKIQVKSQRDITSYLLKWLLSKSQMITSVGKVGKKWQKWTFINCWWECKVVQSLAETVWRFPRKIKNWTTIISSNSTSGCISKGDKITILKKHLNSPVHCCIFSNSYDKKTI